MAVDRLSSQPSGPAVDADAQELARLRDFFNNAQIGLHWVGPDGTILRANRADYESLGYSEHEYVGHHIAEFHADGDVIGDILTRLTNGETLYEYPARLKCKDGTVRDVVINSSVHFVDGRFANTRCMTRDITDERRAYKAVRSSEERYRALVQALPALVAITTTTGEIDDISESYANYTGLTLEEARDWDRHQVIHPDDLDQAMERWQTALTSGQPMQNQMRLRRYDGVYRWHLMQAVPLRSQTGEVVRWMTVSIDIEERKRAEDHERYLADATAKLVSPLDSSELLANIARLAVPTLADICAIGIFDDSAHTARVETAGADERERPYVDAVHLRSWLAAPDSERTIGEAIVAGAPVFIPDFSADWIERCAPNEQQRQVALAISGVSVICVPLMARGTTMGMTTFATTARSGRRYGERDLALLREVAARLSIAIENGRLVEDLRAANAAKDEFLGLVSHELKTPLTTIRGNAGILYRDQPGIADADKRAALADIMHDSDRLHRIIENLLLLARLEQGQILEREPVLPDRVLRRVIARHQRRNRALVFDFEERHLPWPVNSSEEYLEPIVENLISNAEKYSPTGSPIAIDVERSDDEVRIRVLDRGIGITRERADDLFRPFYRSDVASRRADGLGIGLAVCKRLVEAQGGRMWAAPRDGGGSEFGFALPIIDDVVESS